MNNTDIWTGEGKYGHADDPDAVAAWKGVPLDFPRIQGLDIVGNVVGVGSNVDDGWVGRRVLIDPIAVYAGDYPDQIAGPVVPFDIRRLYLQQRTLIGSTMHARADFAELAAIATAGSVQPLVAATFPLSEIARAQERFLAKDFVGKLIIEP